MVTPFGAARCHVCAVGAFSHADGPGDGPQDASRETWDLAK